jgi:chromosome partitioning protein
MSLRTICFTNQKGGVGKTTSCVNLSAITALAGKRCLVIDMDPQGNSSMAYQVYNPEEPDIADILFGRASFNDVIKTSSYANVDVLQNNGKTDEPGVKWIQSGKSESDIFGLKTMIDEIRDQYDFVFIDTNPSRNIFTNISLVASDYVIIPVDAAGYSYEGIRSLLNNIYDIQDNYNSKLMLLGALLCNEDLRTNVVQSAQSSYDKIFTEMNIKTVIRHDVMIKQAAFAPIYFTRKRTNAGNDYLMLAKELGTISLSEFETLRKIYGKENKRLNTKAKGRNGR